MKHTFILLGTLFVVAALAACVAIPAGPQGAPGPTPTATPCVQAPRAASAGGAATTAPGAMTSGSAKGSRQQATLSTQDYATRQAAMEPANPAAPVSGCPTATPLPGGGTRPPESGTPAGR